MIDYGQSAAKHLSKEQSLYDEGSTTIPRKGSTILIELEKAHTKLYNLDDFKDQNTGIYIIYSELKDKCYIGSAFNIKNRLIRHLNYLKRNAHHSLKLQRAFNKYGKNYFKIGVLQYCTKNELSDLEKIWIDKLNSYKDGYNSTDVCRDYKNFNLTTEQIQKRISKSQKKVIALDFEGCIFKKFNSVSEAANFFKTSSSNISRCCKGSLNYMKDHLFVYEKDYDPTKDYTYKPEKRIFTKEHCEKISSKLKGRPKTKVQIECVIKRCSKPIKRINLNTKDETLYSSMKDCCFENKLYIKTLNKAIMLKTPLGEFLYEFVKI